MRNFLRAFWWDEEGQATTEYLLILSVGVSMTLIVIKKLIQPAFQKLVALVEGSIQNRFFNSDLHTFRVQ